MSAVTDGIDSGLSARFADLMAAQAAFFGAHGRYAHFCPTHSSIPQDGVAVAPDQGDLVPTPDFISWNSAGQLPATMESCLRVDSYVGPQGHGWVASLRVYQGNDLWERVVNVGPEIYRAKAWSIVETFTLGGGAS